jgi:hypothetical protein
MATDLELGWLAGIVEGEGTFTMNRYASGQRSPRVAVKMCDEDVVRRVHVVAGCGKVRFVGRAQEHHKDAWIWLLQRKAECQAFGELMFPLMGERRQVQIRRMIDEGCVLVHRHVWYAGWDAVPGLESFSRVCSTCGLAEVASESPPERSVRVEAPEVPEATFVALDEPVAPGAGWGPQPWN